jgi:hypothetical protein
VYSSVVATGRNTDGQVHCCGAFSCDDPALPSPRSLVLANIPMIVRQTDRDAVAGLLIPDRAANKGV